ncbi:MAG: uroporphyrinogen decarboxylase family protein [Armatimonadota bacterium]
MRNHREDIELALAGGAPEIIPFTFYDALFPRDFDPAPLYARGLAICARRNVYTRVTPNVKLTEVPQADGSIRFYYETPVGNVTALWKPAALGQAPVEHPIKTRDDYRIVKFIVEDARYLPAYDTFQAAIEKVGTAGKVIGHSFYEPLLDIQVMWVGQEQFCYELADNEDALMDLHDALAKNHLLMYEVAAAGPADHVLYGGNIVPEMLGPERVRDHVAPCWNAFAERLHDKGKKIGCHLDANNLTILDIVRDSALDFIEAFTPPPDCNVSVADARAAWPEKRLWANFPSSVHIQSDDEIRQATLEIVQQAGDRKGFLLGVTEDIPRQHIARSVTTILETLESCPL